MKKAVIDKKHDCMNKQHLYWKLANGKRYQIKTKEHKGKISKLYELQISTNNLDGFADEDKAIFQQMENEVDSSDFDFEDLIAELNNIKI